MNLLFKKQMCSFYRCLLSPARIRKPLTHICSCGHWKKVICCFLTVCRADPSSIRKIIHLGCLCVKILVCPGFLLLGFVRSSVTDSNMHIDQLPLHMEKDNHSFGRALKLKWMNQSRTHWGKLCSHFCQPHFLHEVKFHVTLYHMEFMINPGLAASKPKPWDWRLRWGWI